MSDKNLEFKEMVFRLSKHDKRIGSEWLVRPRSYGMQWSRSLGRTCDLRELSPECFASLDFLVRLCQDKRTKNSIEICDVENVIESFNIGPIFSKFIECWNVSNFFIGK